jgi:hypothetical protein
MCNRWQNRQNVTFPPHSSIGVTERPVVEAILKIKTLPVESVISLLNGEKPLNERRLWGNFSRFCC